MTKSLNQATVDELSNQLLKKGHILGKMTQTEFMLCLLTSPMPNVELAVIKPGTKKILLTYRQDRNFTGWHFPGSHICQFESIKACCQRIAKDEIGIKIKNIRLAGVKNYNSSKIHKRYYKGKFIPNHYLGLICIVEPLQTPKAGQFFDRLPKNIITVHKDVWQIVQKFFKNSNLAPIVEE